MILGFKDSFGAWIAQPEGIAENFTTYYQHLFESSNPTLGLNSMVKVVTDDMNAQLSQEFMAWEVEVTLKQMASLKALGPDAYCFAGLIQMNVKRCLIFLPPMKACLDNKLIEAKHQSSLAIHHSRHEE